MKTKILCPLLTIIVLLFSCDDILVNPEKAITRGDYIGVWNVSDTEYKNSYSVEIIAASSDTNMVYIKNFGGIGYGLEAPYAIVDEDLITLPQQTVSDLEISGTGTMGSDQITWSYSIFDGADLLNYSAVYSK